MSSMTAVEKQYLEALLDMGGGYVLDFSDATYGQFFRRHSIDIHSRKYQTYGTSKAKKMRAFWDLEPDAVVGEVLSELLDTYEANCAINGRKPDSAILGKSHTTVARLSGKAPSRQAAPTPDDFLNREYAIPNVRRLPIEAAVVPIIQCRLDEIRAVLRAGAYLSAIFLCGSVLEAVLLGAAQRSPEKHNRASASPKDKNGKVRDFPSWSLAQHIDVAYEVGLLGLDVKTFSHGLRDFRNSIHPYDQLSSGFIPDEHTAKICFQVLKAALASVAGERR